MTVMNISAYDLAQRFVGVKETPGLHSTPLVLAMLQLDGAWPTDDAVPSARVQGFGQGSTEIPSACDATAQGLRVHADSLRPANGGVSDPVAGQTQRGARIGNLLAARCPTAVARLVRAIVIDPIDRMLGARLRPHVRKERGETVAPSLADCDPAPAVVRILRRVRVQAAALHRSPRSVLRRQRARVRQVVCGSCSSVTTAGDGSAGPQNRSRLHRCVPAVASTHPLLPQRVVAFNGERTESLADDVASSSPHLLIIAAR